MRPNKLIEKQIYGTLKPQKLLLATGHLKLPNKNVKKTVMWFYRIFIINFIEWAKSIVLGACEGLRQASNGIHLVKAIRKLEFS